MYIQNNIIGCLGGIKTKISFLLFPSGGMLELGIADCSLSVILKDNASGLTKRIIMSFDAINYI